MSAMRTLMYPTSEIWFMFVVVALLLFGIFVALCVACSRLRGTSNQTEMINEKLSSINDILAFLQVAPTLAESSKESQSQPESEIKNWEDQITENVEPKTQDKVQSPYERFAEKKEAEASENKNAQSSMDRRVARYRRKEEK